mgnify:CR=1 FL=1
MLVPKRITPRKLVIEIGALAAVVGLTLYFLIGSMQPSAEPPADSAAAVPGGSLLPALPDLPASVSLFETVQFQSLQPSADLPVQSGPTGKANPFSTSTSPVAAPPTTPRPAR